VDDLGNNIPAYAPATPRACIDWYCGTTRTPPAEARSAPSPVASISVVVLFLLLIVAPLVELYVIFQVAHVIGGWETIALLIVESAIGAWLLRRQGMSTLVRISQAVEERRAPGKELVDGLLILIAGTLMLAPGFVGDVIGYLLLFPPTRAPVRAVLLNRFQAGRYGSVFTATTGARTRFVGTFRASGVRDVHDTSGRDHPDQPPVTELGP